MYADKAEVLVRAAIAEALGETQGNCDLSDNFRENLACDSLDFIEVIMKVEEHTGLVVADEDAEAWETVQDVVDYVKRQA